MEYKGFSTLRMSSEGPQQTLVKGPSKVSVPLGDAILAVEIPLDSGLFLGVSVGKYWRADGQ